MASRVTTSWRVISEVNRLRIAALRNIVRFPDGMRMIGARGRRAVAGGTTAGDAP